MALLLLKKSVNGLLTKLPKHENRFPRYILSKAFSTTVDDEEELKAMYNAYLIDNKKFYTPKEKNMRFQIFKDTLTFVDHYNSTSSDPYDKVGLTSLADVAMEEDTGAPFEQPVLLTHQPIEKVDWTPVVDPPTTFCPIKDEDEDEDEEEEEEEGEDEVIDLASYWRKSGPPPIDPPITPSTDEEVKAMYESFLVEHKKVYTPEEKEKRFKLFKGTLRYIDHHNSTFLHPSCKIGLTQQADVAVEEISRNRSRSQLVHPPPKIKAISTALLVDEELKAMYESFLVEHEKFYDAPEEKEKGFQTFKDTLKFIDHHNFAHRVPCKDQGNCG